MKSTKHYVYSIAAISMSILYSAVCATPHKTAEELPKAPKAIYEMFGKQLRTADNKPVAVDTLSGKIIGIYFSAHWCPPCRTFTPVLVKFYDTLKAENKPFEIVFVSFDNTEDDMYKYMKETNMKWSALPFGDKNKDQLSSKFKVSGIPTLVIVNTDGELITTDGRNAVSSNGTKAFEAWEKILKSQ